MTMETKLPDLGANGLRAGALPNPPARAGLVGAPPSEFKNLVADVEDLISASTSLTKQDMAATKARLSERVASARASIQEMSGAVTERTRKAAAETNGYVHAQPWNAIGVGTVLGFLLGVLVARRA